jgi:hypothetical protein
VRKELGGIDIFLAIERMPDDELPRDVNGVIEVNSVNGPHGFRPVFFEGRQTDNAMAWTSALFITFD